MILRRFITIICLLLSFLAVTQELPPIQNFSPQNYNGENQNWGITQGTQGHIYVANNHNLLEYDGVKWHKYQSSHTSIYRSIQVKDSLIFTGQYMEFGFWKKDIYGNLKYTSISSELQEPMILDEEFWNIVILDEWVLFQSLDRIYNYNTITKQFKILNAKSTKAHIFRVEDTVYFQDENLGVYRIENGEKVLVIDYTVLEGKNVVGMYKENKGLLVILDNAKFLKIIDDNVEEWKIDDIDEIGAINLYTTARLNDSSFVLGTISKGMYHINADGKFLMSINQRNGLNNNTILSIFQDRDDNLWLGLDNGLSVININSPFNEYIDNIGRLGLVYASIFYNDKLYLGTNQGLFVKSSKDNVDFELIEGTDGQVWSLNLVEDTLFCGHNKGTFIVNDKDANLISSFPGTWSVKTIKGRKDILIQGNFNGLSILRKDKNTWKFSNSIEGFDISSRFFEILSSHKVLVNHEYKGLHELTFDQNYTKVKKRVTHPIMGYGSSLLNYQDEIIYASIEGAFKKQKDTLLFKPDSILLDLLFTQSGGVTSIMMPDKESNRFWCFTHKGLSFLNPQTFRATYAINTIPIPSFFRSSLGVSGFENLTRIDDELYLIGISNGFVTLDLNKYDEKISYKVDLNSVATKKGYDKEIKASLNENIEFEYEQNSISFEYGVPQYNKYNDIVYQYKLEGLFDDWNDWSNKTNTTFNNLEYGDYIFNIRAKVGGKLSENIASYSFTISRPWYLSVLALILYFFTLVILFFGIHKLYKSYYTQKQMNLLSVEKRKQKRKKLKTAKELAQIRNEKLKSEIESKNRELAVATMSMIKKNELLNSIKDQLIIADNPSKIKSVISTINKNINNDDDWKFFQEAFNNADKDFLKKIKEKHQELTANDLRLCAYLRLNLSSKEIAPLLNISVRSVEVKRYRLRKKMDLPHENGLVNYILEL